MSGVHITARLSSRCYHSNEYVRGIMKLQLRETNKENISFLERLSICLAIQAHLTFHSSPPPTLQRNATESSSNTKHSTCILQTESQKHHVELSDKGTSSLSFAIALPTVCCTSFHVTLARVVYMLTGVVETPHTKTSMHLPFEVYGSVTYTFSMFPVANFESESPKLFIANESSVGVRKGTEMPFEVVPYNSRRETIEKMSVYVIKTGTERLLECSISKPFYYVGENILCVLNFTRSNIKCKRIVAMLLRQEKSDATLHSKVIASFAEETASTLETNCRLTIPKQAIPTIQTNYISIQWIIQFDFIMDPSTHSNQTIKWQIPIVIKCPRPSIQTIQSLANIPERFYTGCRRELVL